MKYIFLYKKYNILKISDFLICNKIYLLIYNNSLNSVLLKFIKNKFNISIISNSIF